MRNILIAASVIVLAASSRFAFSADQDAPRADTETVVFRQHLSIGGGELVVIKGPVVFAGAMLGIWPDQFVDKLSTVRVARAEVHLPGPSAPITIWSGIFGTSKDPQAKDQFKVLSAALEQQQFVIAIWNGGEIFLYRCTYDATSWNATSVVAKLRAQDWSMYASPGSQDRRDLDAKLRFNADGLWQIDVSQHPGDHDFASHFQQIKDSWQFELTGREGWPDSQPKPPPPKPQKL